MARLQDLVLDRVGDVVLFELLSHAREGYGDVLRALQVSKVTSVDNGGEPYLSFKLDDEDDATRKRNIDEAFAFAANCDIVTHNQHQKHAGGSWSDFVIGLVGKPSAGKSTLFNAITDPKDISEMAKVAAHPFTTIEPNFGSGYAGMVCPCQEYGLSKMCGAKYGHICAGVRRVPIRVKDVAGLVPGAYAGLGTEISFSKICVMQMS